MAVDTYTQLLTEALSSVGDAIAASDVDGRSVSGNELLRLVNRIAGLLADLGLQPGDGLAQLASNRLDAFAVMAACLRGGIRYTPLHPLGSLEQQSHIVLDAQAKALVIDSQAFYEHGAKLAKVFGRLEVLTLSSAEYGRHLSDLLEGSSAPQYEPKGADIAWVTYTGGTTGRTQRCCAHSGEYGGDGGDLDQGVGISPRPSFPGVLADQPRGRIFGAAGASLGWHGVLDAVFLTQRGFRLY